MPYRIKDQSDTVAFLQVGDTVETPDGPAKVVQIALQLADYHGDQQIEPPAIVVQFPDGKVKRCCLCELDFGLPEVNETVASEFARLWPPMDEAVPSAAEVAERQARTVIEQQRRAGVGLSDLASEVINLLRNIESEVIEADADDNRSWLEEAFDSLRKL